MVEVVESSLKNPLIFLVKKDFLILSFSISLRPLQKFRLRVSGQDWRETHIRDALMHTLVSKTQIDIQAYQPVVLYMNGKYWGIYNLREKFNKAYLQQHHQAEQVDILERNSRLIDGSSDEYLEAFEFCKRQRFEKRFCLGIGLNLK